jgi:hypothetical protein
MLMKKINLYSFCLILFAAIAVTGCYKMQKDYDYNPQEIDPHYDMTVKEFLLSRGSAGVGSDTPFKWMQKAIEYAGFDLAEYEKPGRTYILLHTDAVRRLTSNRVTAGFFFDYPIIVKDGLGNPIKSLVNPAVDSTRPATSWNEYSQETVTNLLRYLIIEGEYGFDNLTTTNTSVKTLLAAGTVVDPKDSKLAWVVTKTSPNPETSLMTSVTFDPTGGTGTGFDPEGKMNLRIGNNDVSPIIMNDRSWDRTAGFYFTNGRGHVFLSTSGSAPSTAIHPFRYSY